MVTVVGTNELHQCKESDTIFVKLLQPITEIFTVFTPNGDGVNDYWEMPYQPDLEVFIYDRWGQLIFHTTHYGTDNYNKWDGKSQKNGKNLPIGTYYYIIKPNKVKQNPLNGTVTIIR
jgi:gliding motility-associated-like protein